MRVLHGAFFVDFSRANYGSVEGQIDASYTFYDFKNDVEAALKKKFGADGYKRSSKAFNVHPNDYRVHADVVAALEYREYLPSAVNPATNLAVATYTEPTGTKFICDGSYKSIVNWPEQHYDQGVLKNIRTGSRFKFIVRALKRLKFYMAAHGRPSVESFPSYLIECLVYRAPDAYFKGDSYYQNLKSVLAHAIAGTMDAEKYSSWQEVNENKLLFSADQSWTVKDAHDFCLAAWLTVGFSL